MKYFFLCLRKRLYGFSFIVCWYGELHWLISLNQAYSHARRQWQPTPVLLPGKSHGRRSLVGCSQWGHKESDMTEWLCFHFLLLCVGEGNGHPLQCSCLENPRGAWWAAIYGVAQSWPRLKRLSSSSSNYLIFWKLTNIIKYHQN